jgi:hypothetical protein
MAGVSTARELPRAFWLLVMRRIAEEPDYLLTTRARARSLASLSRTCKAMHEDVAALGWPALWTTIAEPKYLESVAALCGADLTLSTDDDMRTFACRLGISLMRSYHASPDPHPDPGHHRYSTAALRSAVVRERARALRAPLEVALRVRLVSEAFVSPRLTLAAARERFSLRRQDMGLSSARVGAFTELDARDACHARFGSEAAWRRHHVRARARAAKALATRRARDDIEEVPRLPTVIQAHVRRVRSRVGS